MLKSNFNSDTIVTISEGVQYSHDFKKSILFGKSVNLGNVHYWAYSDPDGDDPECIHEAIVSALKGDSDNDYYHYALVRHGTPPRCAYYPLPMLVEAVKSGDATRYQKKKLRRVYHFYGLNVHSYIKNA